MNIHSIVAQLPYRDPFLFVDELVHADEEHIIGCYTFDESLDFYKGHFLDKPVTPGVILTETMAQIGLACFGIYLMQGECKKLTTIALTSTDVQFLKPVYPNEKVTVIAHKIYFRFGKLKCAVLMKNAAGIEVCKGILAGMVIEDI